MTRKIVRYEPANRTGWIAVLECGHERLVYHKTPSGTAFCDDCAAQASDEAICYGCGRPFNNTNVPKPGLCEACK